MKVNLLSLALASTVSAFWRLECHGRSGLARIDPLVNPGVPAHHVHAIHGGKNLGFSSTYEDLRASECTSCSVKEDLSAYWFPPLYFQHDNGKLEIVEQVGGMLVYYIQIGENVKAFPRGFGMVSGDTRRRNFTGPIPDLETSFWTEEDRSQASLEAKALGFNCLNYGREAERFGSRHFMPSKEFLDANCKDGLRLELIFPSCWNGKDATSPDSKSHVRYSSMLQGGSCPEGFETRIPTILFESIFNTNAFNGVPGRFVLGNGDPTGNGFHGDLMTGWEPEFLQAALDQCRDPSGLQQNCPLFTIQSQEEERKCKLDVPAAIANEDCIAPGNQLPGNVQIYDGPGYAPAPGDPAPPPPQVEAPQSLSLGYTPGKLIITEGGGDIITIAKNFLPPGQAANGLSADPTALPPHEGEVNQAPANNNNEAPVNNAAEPAPAPTPPPEPVGPPKNIVETSTFTSDGTVYEVAIEEIYVTVTEVVTLTRPSKRGVIGRHRRHGHARHA